MSAEDRLTGVESRLQEVERIASSEMTDIRRMQTGFESAGNTLEAQTTGLASDVEMMKAQLKEILTHHTGRLDALEKAPARASSGGGTSFVKASLDSKAIMALKMLGNDRSEYRRWKEKF